MGQLITKISNLYMYTHICVLGIPISKRIGQNGGASTVWSCFSTILTNIFSYELLLNSETGKVGVTSGELKGSLVRAREAHRRLGADVCDGVVLLSYRHVYEHLLVHDDGISRLDGATTVRDGG